MRRYCTNCQTENIYDIERPEDMEHLYCHNCGAHIDKHSKSATACGNEDHSQMEGIVAVGTRYMAIFLYYYYFALALSGIAAYWFERDTLLYSVTLFIVASYGIFHLFRYEGAVFFALFSALAVLSATYLWQLDLRQQCLMIHTIFAIRHLCKELLLHLFIKVHRWIQ